MPPHLNLGPSLLRMMNPYPGIPGPLNIPLLPPHPMIPHAGVQFPVS